MFEFSKECFPDLLKTYDVYNTISETSELLRLICDVDKQDSKEFKLFYKVSFLDREPIVIKFRGGCTTRNKPDIIEKQTEFSDLLRTNNIITPKYYKTGSGFVQRIMIKGYDLSVTVEDFAKNEIKTVNDSISFLQGQLLAKIHNVSEKYECHVPNKTPLNPFTDNDLFSFEEFSKIKQTLPVVFFNDFDEIVASYRIKKKRLEPISK